jgi:hypothetical protein
VQLALAGEQQLVRLRVAGVADRGVFLLQPLHGGADLVLVAAALRLDRVGEHRLDPISLNAVAVFRPASLVCVSFSLATAQVAAFSSATWVCVFPCRQSVSALSRIA